MMHVARLHVEGKQLDDAVVWLKKAVAADVLVFERQVMDREFDALIDHPWFEGARTGAISREVLRRGGHDVSFV